MRLTHRRLVARQIAEQPVRDVRMVFVISGHYACRRVAALGLLLARSHQSVEVEFVRVALAVHFCHYVFVVVISANETRARRSGLVLLN